jgi:hypothetical protein
VPHLVNTHYPIFRRITVSLLAALTLLPALAGAENSLTPHVAEYKIKVSVLSGRLRTELKASETGYSAKSVLKAAGIASWFVRGDVTESAEFSIIGSGVRPLTFRSVDKVSKNDKFMEFKFDWEQDRVSGTINEETFELELQGRTHDRVSLQYELMLELLNNRRSDEYSLLDSEDFKVLHVSYAGEEDVKVPFGEFRAIKIQHRKENSDRVTTLWCAEELDYLPVKIEQHRDGKLAVRAVLNKYNPTEGAPTT